MDEATDSHTESGRSINDAHQRPIAESLLVEGIIITTIF